MRVLIPTLKMRYDIKSRGSDDIFALPRSPPGVLVSEVKSARLYPLDASISKILPERKRQRKKMEAKSRCRQPEPWVITFVLNLCIHT